MSRIRETMGRESVEGSSSSSEEKKEVVKKERRQRIPIGVPRQKLSVSNEIPGYRLYWFNDYPGRIEAAEAAGYEFVTNQEVKINDFVTVGNADLGSKVKRLVGKNEDGSPLYAYLMKIRLEWFEEDQRELQAQIDRTDSSIRRGTLSPAEYQYVPSSGITYKT